MDIGLNTGTSPMRKRKANIPVMAQVRLNNLGDGSLNRAEVEVVDVEAPVLITFPRPLAVQNLINDNYWVKDPSGLFRDQTQFKLETVVKCHVVSLAHCVIGPSQKKDISPSLLKDQIKCVKGAPCVSHCLSVPVVTSALNVVKNPHVGGRLQKCGQVWLSQGSNPRVVSILKEGYALPFKVRPPRSRSPVIFSGYANRVKNKHLKESLQALIQKQAVEKVVVPSSLAFYNRLFLVSKRVCTTVLSAPTYGQCPKMQ